MMNRKEFLKRLGVGIATSFVAFVGLKSLFDKPKPVEYSWSIEKTTVTAKTRKLKAEYSIELEQDLQVYHSPEAEEELSRILMEEMHKKIKAEVVRGMIV